MAIFAPDISVCTRGASAGAVASAAYISRSQLECERDGISYDYARSHTHERLVCDLGIEAPEHTPERLLDRSTLWNEVERIEKRSDAQLCRKLMVPLPDELTEQQNIELARQMVADRVAEGHIIDAAIHCNRDGSNMHLHMLEPLREADERGFKPKSENVYLVRDIEHQRDQKMTSNELKQAKERGEEWEKVYTYKDGRQLTQTQARQHDLDPIKDRKSKTPIQETRYLNNWNDRDRAEVWREGWSKRMNEALERAGREERVDHRSYERQGLERVPQLHEGYEVRAIERKAERQAAEQGREYQPVTDVRQKNVEIREFNRTWERAREVIKTIERQIKQAPQRVAEKVQEIGREVRNGLELARQTLVRSINEPGFAYPYQGLRQTYKLQERERAIEHRTIRPQLEKSRELKQERSMNREEPQHERGMSRAAPPPRQQQSPDLGRDLEWAREAAASWNREMDIGRDFGPNLGR